MFIEILPILIKIFLFLLSSSLSVIETTPIISISNNNNNNERNCSISKLGCNCQNIEIITKDSVELCCKADLKTLLISGLEVRNLSIDIVDSSCSDAFVNLVIRDTAISGFNFQLSGLKNISHIYIEKNQNLSSFNKLIFSTISSKIETISVEHNIIRTISAKTFGNLMNLTMLKLSDNKIGFIEDLSFVDLTNLSSLYLNNNLLTMLNSNVFKGLEKLKVLSLFNNFLLSLKENYFQHLRNLQFLYLSNSGTTELVESNLLPDNVFFQLKRLKHLNMTLKIRNLTSNTFYGLNELDMLDLPGNSLTIIPSGTLQQLPRVSTINLSKNQIRCLFADTFRLLPRLTTLDLSFNELSFISNEVFSDLMSLLTLDLLENNIYVIEKNAFVGMKNLMLLKINAVHGKAKNELQNNFRGSALGKLRNDTKIVGLYEYLGISVGLDEPAEKMTENSNLDSKKNVCPVAEASDKDWVDSSHAGSRKYLLIIVGICVVFLLIAFAIIMSYRAWSKRKMSDSSLNVNVYEKQEMLVNNTNVVNGRVDSKSHSKSSFTRKSLNGSYMSDVPVDKTVDTKADSILNNQTQQPNSNNNNRNTPASTKPTTCPLSNERNHSDDESALTPLGVL